MIDTTLAPQQTTAKPLINCRNVSKQFNTKSGTVGVLHDISFSIPQNSFAIIFGPSGSGKTTLMNVLSGLEPPTSGVLTIDDQNLYKLEPDQRAHFRAKNMGIVHQVNYWIKSLTVLENVAMPLYLSGSTKVEALRAAKDSLEQVGMGRYGDYQPTVLSGGQQQRVSMARALVSGTELILADEPTGNLDTKNGQMIMDLLISCQRDLKRTVILVTHNIEYLPLSDKQLYIMDGRLTESSRGQKMPAEILDSLKTQINELTRMERG